MSLDVYLYSKEETEIECRFCGCKIKEKELLYEANITHNLNRMAQAAGIYEHLWRPDEIGITNASELIKPLKAGLMKMKVDPERFKIYEPENKWGTYENFVPWIEEYIAACEENPNAIVEVSR